jgi:hypothetical protein
MIVRIATFLKRPDVDPQRHDEFRRWIGEQPGCLAGYHVVGDDGRVLSLSFWESHEALLALKSRVFPGPPLSMKPDEVMVYEVEAVFGPHVPPLG